MYETKSTAELRQIAQNAMEAIARGGSPTLQKARYGVLGAVSAVLATRKA